jgi:hypothetical protein
MTAIRKIDESEAQAILDRWPGYEPNEMELNSFLYVRGERHGREEGLAAGLAAGILAVLDQREIAIDDPTRERLLACRDLAQLDEWMRRAVRVESAEQLFG